MNGMDTGIYTVRTRQDYEWSEWQEVESPAEWLRLGSIPGITAELRVQSYLLEGDDLEGY